MVSRGGRTLSPRGYSPPRRGPGPDVGALMCTCCSEVLHGRLAGPYTTELGESWAQRALDRVGPAPGQSVGASRSAATNSISQATLPDLDCDVPDAHRRAAHPSSGVDLIVAAGHGQAHRGIDGLGGRTSCPPSGLTPATVDVPEAIASVATRAASRLPTRRREARRRASCSGRTARPSRYSPCGPPCDRLRRCSRRQRRRSRIPRGSRRALRTQSCSRSRPRRPRPSASRSV